MKKPINLVNCFLLNILLLTSFLCGTIAQAETSQSMIKPNSAKPMPTMIPAAPQLNVKGYVLMDSDSGQILASKNMDEKVEPASLTKMMTLYVIANSLKNGQIHLEDKVRISKKAWKMDGSRMFVKEGSYVSVKELVQGIVVASGNDACTAMAEYIAGTEDAFAQIMNKTARYLGMMNTHYVDSTGLPRSDHYSTPHDMAILARAIIHDFPEYYSWYKQKWFAYNGIKQPNRNRLLWRDPSVDGLKTGHTKAAGYCLVASAKRDGMRLITVTMGATSDESRNASDAALLNYGFRFFKTYKLFDAYTPIVKTRVWLAAQNKIGLGLSEPLYVTIPVNELKNLEAKTSVQSTLKAPIYKGMSVGKVTIELDNQVIRSAQLVAINDNLKGNLWTRFWDHLILFFKKIF